MSINDLGLYSPLATLFRCVVLVRMLATLTLLLRAALSADPMMRFMAAEGIIHFPSDAKLTATCGEGTPTTTLIIDDRAAAVLSVRLGNVLPSCAAVADLRQPCVAERPELMPPLWYCVFSNTTEQVVQGPLSAHRVLDTIDGHRLAVATYVNCSLPTEADMAVGSYNLTIRYWAPSGAEAINLPFLGVERGNLVNVTYYSPPSPPPSTPPLSPPAPPPASPPPEPPPALVFWSDQGSGSGTATWLGPSSPYSCAVVDHVFIGDFDVVIAVYGHSYVGMGMGYGNVDASFNLHQGHFGQSCYGHSLSQWYDFGGSMSYSGGYHWPYPQASNPTQNKLIYTRFARRGNTLYQWYDLKVSASESYPQTDEAWTPITSYGGPTISVSTGTNVIILVGEAGRPQSPWTGEYKLMRFGTPAPGTRR